MKQLRVNHMKRSLDRYVREQSKTYKISLVWNCSTNNSEVLVEIWVNASRDIFIPENIT